jgi:3-hydroxybutyrate dehydrogenase
MRGKCALITGSTAGLGAATAARLAAEGCNIVLNGFGDLDAIEAQRRVLEKTHGVRVLYQGADLSKPADTAELMVSAIEAFGAVDILVNNAVVRHFAPIQEFPVEAWDRAMQ